MNSQRRNISARWINSIVIALVMYMGACSGLRIPQPLSEDASDWTMFAKHETRHNATTESITPPLVPVWSYDITGGIGNGSPLIIDSVLVIGNLRGELYGLNAFTGKRIGWIDLGDAIQGSPVVDGNVAIVALSNTELSLVAFDLVEGTVLWKKEYGDIEASPLLHAGKIYVGNTEGSFNCIDRTTGERIWKFEIPENTRHKGIRSSAAGTVDVVVFGAEDGTLYALDAERGHQKWRYSTGASIVGSPCIAEGNVYIGNLDGTVSTVDLQTGEVRWQLNTGTSIYANISFANSRVFVGTTGGTMFAFKAPTGEPVWTVDLGSVINSGATIASNTIYVGTLKKTLFGLNVTDGSVILKQEVGGRIKTSPSVANGMLYVATDEKNIIAFKGSIP